MGAADYPPVTEETLPSLIEGEIARSIGHFDGSLASERAMEMNYYFGEPFGNEVEGESQVVSTDVADTVESILPIILNIFTASDDVVRFDANGPEDEEQAAQQTEAANYVFYRQNNGFLVLYEWFKDSLIQKNGIVKYWWEDKKTNTQESWQGLTEGEYRMLSEDKSYFQFEEVKHETYDDPAAVQARDMMQQKIASAPPQMQPQLQMVLDQQPIPQLHDLTAKITKDVSKICIEAIPPEEFGISAQHNCVSIQDTTFCYHRTKKSISQLREMGVPDEIIDSLGPANEPDNSQEALARDRFLGDTWREAATSVNKDVWLTECFYRVDYDNDGVAELRHIIMPGRTVWVNEECDHINFAALTPIIMPHRWIGRSIAELVMDIQFNKSVLKRQMYNNLYLTNNPQKAVLSSAGGIVQANLDDLLTSRAGGILREYVPGAIRHVETPFVAEKSFSMIEYEDGVKENRTGVTRYNQGTDADSLNKTARGIQMIQTAGAQRTNLIARIFAETGVKDLMRGIVYMLSKYSSKAMTLKLRNKWVDIDPREWKTQYNMTVNVGLGTGNRDVQLQHLTLLHQQQIELMKEGRGYMVSDDNIYNMYRKMSEAMGFKHPELFVTDPKNIPPQAKQPRPDPAIVKATLDAKEGQAKLAQAAQKDQLTVQSEQAIAQLEAQSAQSAAQLDSQTKLAIAQLEAQTQKEIEAMKINAQGQIAVFEKNADAQAQLVDKGAENQGAQQEILKKATELDVREIKVSYDEQILALKKQVEQMAEQKRKELETASVGRAEQHEEKTVNQIQVSLDAVAKALAEIGKMNAELGKALKKDEKISIKNIQTDKSGRITGAEINKTVN